MSYKVVIDICVEGDPIQSGEGKDLKAAMKDLWLNYTADLIDGMEPNDPDRDSTRLNFFPSDILDYFSGMGEEYMIVIRNPHIDD